MIIDDSELSRRLNNPMNLINQRKNGGLDSSRKSAMSLFIRPSSEPPAKVEVAKLPEVIPAKANTAIEVPTNNGPEEIKADDIIDNVDGKIGLATAHNNALDLLNRSIEKLSSGIDDIDIKKLPTIIATASRVVTDIRKERLEIDKAGIRKEESVHYHFYCPQPAKLEDYKVIEVA